MYKQLDEFLVTNMPRVWRSRILFFILFSFASTLMFFSLRGSRFLEEDGDSALMFIPVLAAFYWVYTQIKHPPFLRKFSIFEIALTSVINAMCLGLLVLPFLFLHDSFYYSYEGSNYQYTHAVYAVMPFIVYAVLLPCIFLSFIIRDYAASELLILVIGFLGFGGLLIFLVEVFASSSEGRDLFIPIYLLLYLAALIKVLTALFRRQYGSWDKRMIFLLVIGAPWAISAAYALLIRGGGSNDMIPGVEFVDEPYVYYYCGLGTYLFLLVFTWYIARSFEKPMVIK